MTRDRWVGLAVALTAVPVVLLAAGAMFHNGPFSNYGDVAATEVAVERAVDLEETLGPYSRFHWNHPGPALFYLLAVPYSLMDGRGEALVVGTIAINALASSWLVWLVGRRAGGRAALAASTAMACFQLLLSLEYLANAWTPLLLVIPAALFLVVCADVVAGGRWSLCGAVAVGSYLVQTHIGMSLAVAAALALAVTALALRWWRAERPAVPAREHAAPLVLAAAIGLAMWAPPLWQELHGDPGNMTALLRFFGEEGGGQGFGEAAAALGNGMLLVPARDHLSDDVGVWRSPPIALLGMLLGIGAITSIAWRRRQRLATALGLTAGTVALAAYASLLRVEAAITGYLVLWMSAITLGGVLAAVVVVTTPAGHGSSWHAPRRRPASVTSTAVLAVVAVGATAVAAGEARRFDPGGGYTDVTAATDVVAGMVGPTDRGVLVCISSAAAWPPVAGVVADLRRAGVDVRVHDHWAFIFGDDLTPSGGEQVMVELDLALNAPRPIALDPPVATAGTSELRARAYRARDGGAMPASACPTVM